jgi:hypothetical protein
MDKYTRQWLVPAIAGFLLIVAAIMVQFYIGFYFLSFGMVMIGGMMMWVILFVEPPPGGVIVKGRTLIMAVVTFALLVPWLHFAGLLYQSPVPLVLAALMAILFLLAIWNDFLRGRARKK